MSCSRQFDFSSQPKLSLLEPTSGRYPVVCRGACFVATPTTACVPRWRWCHVNSNRCTPLVKEAFPRAASVLDATLFLRIQSLSSDDLPPFLKVMFLLLSLRLHEPKPSSGIGVRLRKIATRGGISPDGTYVFPMSFDRQLLVRFYLLIVQLVWNEKDIGK